MDLTSHSAPWNYHKKTQRHTYFVKFRGDDNKIPIDVVAIGFNHDSNTFLRVIESVIEKHAYILNKTMMYAIYITRQATNK